jgi:hypothetical protein
MRRNVIRLTVALVLGAGGFAAAAVASGNSPLALLGDAAATTETTGTTATPATTETTATTATTHTTTTTAPTKTTRTTACA